MEIERFNVRIPPALAAGLRALAKENRRSINTELIIAIEKIVNPQKISTEPENTTENDAIK